MKPSRNFERLGSPQAYPRVLRAAVFALLASLALAPQADSFSAAPQAAAPAQIPVYGPKTYTTGTAGKTDSFTLPPGLTRPCALRIDNGQANGKNRVRDASVQINERIILNARKAYSP